MGTCRDTTIECPACGCNDVDEHTCRMCDYREDNEPECECCEGWGYYYECSNCGEIFTP